MAALPLLTFVLVSCFVPGSALIALFTGLVRAFTVHYVHKGKCPASRLITYTFHVCMIILVYLGALHCSQAFVNRRFLPKPKLCTLVFFLHSVLPVYFVQVIC